MENLHITIHEQSVLIDILTAENERLREIMRRLKEDTREHYEYWIGYGCDGNDAIRFVGDVSNILRAALQPKEGEG